MIYLLGGCCALVNVIVLQLLVLVIRVSVVTMLQLVELVVGRAVGRMLQVAELVVRAIGYRSGLRALLGGR